ncbi:hypothetical protein BJX65DRAFT_303067 [Aspergillus insuetus]
MAMYTKPCNIPGIDYDASFAQCLFQNTQALAGAFGFSNTRDLWDLVLIDEDTKPVIEAWVAERNRLGSHVYKDIRQTSLTQILADTAMQSLLRGDAHPASTPLGRGLIKTETQTLARLTGLWFIIRLIRAKPGLFPRSQVEPTLTINAYDLLHGWKLLKWAWRVNYSRRLPKKPRYQASIRPIFHIPSLVMPVPDQRVPTGLAAGAPTPLIQPETPVYTRDLTPNPVETPEEEEALNLAIVHGLGDGTIALEDTEPIFVEQDESVHSEDTEPLFVYHDESKHEEDKTEDEESETSEVEKVPISDDYVLDSDADAYDSGYETADECYDIQAELRSRKRAKVTAGQTVHEDVDQSATV